MSKFSWIVLAVFLLTLAGVPAQADTFNLVGVTLADGGTITGHFDWNDVAGTYTYTNVDITVTGAGAELGSVTTITQPDPLNTGGLCFVEPAVTQGACTSPSFPSLILIFAQRLGPNNLFPTAPETLSGQICVGNTSCFLNDESEFNFPDGTSVAITAGSVINTTVPEPGTLLTTLLGALGLGFVARSRRSLQSRM